LWFRSFQLVAVLVGFWRWRVSFCVVGFLAVGFHVIREQKDARIMRKMTTIIAMSAGKMMRLIQKITHIAAKTGLETVMPTLLNPFHYICKIWLLRKELLILIFLR
jgi:hypothetical protein